MAKLIFRYTDKEFLEICNEASEIELTLKDDLTIHEFKVMCVRMAAAMGFTEGSIKKAFGELIYEDEATNSLKDLINELNIGRNNKKSK